ncbi:hypothetical protein ACFCV8_17305 [Streptomyces sp. NPDC056347]|uniref:hypothetical protein n=1 Tax=Streptomyces sp. NPDC056347 TaxID=3345790 RepID=UPI0035D58269
MLQCTAYTAIPEIDALVALTTMEGGPGNPPDALVLDDHLLCELGEHDDQHEHAAQLWTAEVPAERDLWLFWTGTGSHRTYRFAELPPCPATTHSESVTRGQGCMFYTEHPDAHSWQVTDPLGVLLAERARQEVQRVWGPDTPDDAS